MTSLANTIGKYFRFDSTWGDHTSFIVETININKEYAKFIGKGYWGKEESHSVPMSLLDDLLKNGKAEKTYEIDHCTIIDLYTLKEI